MASARLVSYALQLVGSLCDPPPKRTNCPCAFGCYHLTNVDGARLAGYVVCAACLYVLARVKSTMARLGYIIVLFHAGLYLTRNFPNWEFVGMLCQVLWIPSVVLDQWGFTTGSSSSDSTSNSDNATIYKKTDRDASPGATKAASSPGRRLLSSNPVSRFLQYFFFLCVHDLQLGLLGTRG